MHYNDDDDNSSLSDNDVMCLNKCPHCNKLFQDQHVWNQFPGPKSHEISLKNLLTIHAEDMKLIVDAILRRSHHEFFLRSSEDLL